MEVEVYREVANNPSRNGEVFFVFVIVVIADAVGQWLALANGSGTRTTDAIIFRALIDLVRLPVSSAYVYFIGSRFFGGSGSIGGLMRAMAYSCVPNVLDVFAFIPLIGDLL